MTILLYISLDGLEHDMSSIISRESVSLAGAEDWKSNILNSISVTFIEGVKDTLKELFLGLLRVTEDRCSGKYDLCLFYALLVF